MLTAMGKLWRTGVVTGVILAAMSLGGCAGAAAEAEPSPSPTPTKSVSPNHDSCVRFATATAGMSDALNADDINTSWGEVRAKMDEAALRAEGDVKERLQSLVDDWPKGSDLWVYQDFDGMNTMLRDVGRACEADGAKVNYSTFVTD